MNSASLPVIDQDTCISCGTCIAICPDRVLVSDDQQRAIVAGEKCMLCGHCRGVCPADAITIPGLRSNLGLATIDEKSVAESDTLVSPEALVQLMKSRRSCRSYKPEKLPLSVLEDLARIGTAAPSGTNSQGWQFVILPDRKEVEQLGELTADFYRRLNSKAANPLYRLIARLFAGDALGRYYNKYYTTIKQGLAEWYEYGVDRLFHGAPSAIVVTGDSFASCPAEDALLATQNILLAAEAKGVATCLIGFVVEAARRDRRVGASLNLKSGEHIYSVIACGYPAVDFQRFSGRKEIHPRIVRIKRDKNESRAS